MSNIDNIKLQIEALSTSLFMKKYNHFESVLKQFYFRSVNLTNNPIIYYYAGCYNSKKSISFDYENDKINFSEINFSKLPSNYINLFTINELLKIDKKYELSSNEFKELLVDSPIKKISYTCFSICFKLISMRNKLAHESSKLDLNPDKDIIELFDTETIEKFFFNEFENYDMNNMNDNTRAILSNVVYIDLLSNEIEKLQLN